MRVILQQSHGSCSEGSNELLDSYLKDNHNRGGADTPRIWVDLDESDDAEATFKLFGADDAVIEQATASRYPPKVEPFDQGVFMLLRGLSASSESIHFGTIQIAMLVGEHFLISRHTAESPSINKVREQLLTSAPGCGHTPADWALQVGDVVVGRYVPIVLNLESRLEQIEEEMFAKPEDRLLEELVQYKRQIKKLRRNASYQATLFNRIQRDHIPLFAGRERLAAEVEEQFERIASLTNLHNELANDLMNGYLSLTSHRLNHIMKVLTVITCIFVPITFLAGIYGMNFEFMPELQSPNAYFVVLSVMAAVVVSLLLMFRRKGWF